jgi:uncharacterized protein (TIGR03089 family)
MGQIADFIGATIASAFAAAVAVDPTRPLLTYYDDDTGERTELSGTTLDNWVAKTANLLVDGCGLDTGDTAAVLLPPHWQTAAVLLGCWSAGIAVDPADPDVVFCAVDRTAQAPAAADRFALGLAPMALPLHDVPPGFVDYVAEVRGHGDRFQPYAPVPADAAAGPDTDHAALLDRARARAAELGIGPADRVLADADTLPDPVDWLLAPLVAGATTVLCARLDPARLARRITDERVTLTPSATT